MAHKLAVIRVLVLSLLAISASCDNSFIDDIKKTVSGDQSGGGGVNFNLDGKGASVGVRTDDSNPFFYEECSAGVSGGGFNAGCSRVWKPLFYVCIAGGGLLAVLLLSCCCCCCCAPCRKKRTVAYQPMMSQSSTVVVNPQQPAYTAPPPGYDVPMLRA